jgi:cytoskeletal protein RodZ
MSEGDLSHRQEREQKKEEHAHPTRGKYLSSKHLTWAMVVCVIVTGAALLIWTFLLPALLGPG